jgi:hypothetical protein
MRRAGTPVPWGGVVGVRDRPLCRFRALMLRIPSHPFFGAESVVMAAMNPHRNETPVDGRNFTLVFNSALRTRSSRRASSAGLSSSRHALTFAALSVAPIALPLKRGIFDHEQPGRYVTRRPPTPVSILCERKNRSDATAPAEAADSSACYPSCSSCSTFLKRLRGSFHRPSFPLHGIGRASGRGFASTKPQGPSNHLDR